MALFRKKKDEETYEGVHVYDEEYDERRVRRRRVR